MGIGHENTLHSGSGCVPLLNFPDTRYRLVGPPQPVSTCVLYKYDLIVVCREQAVLCDDLYLTVIHILMWAALNEACY